MRPTTIPFLFLMIITATFSSCSTGWKFDLNKPIDPGNVISVVEARNVRLRSMTANGKLSVDTPEFANTGSLSLRLSKPDSLLIEISGPFGVSVAKGFITKQSFTFYNGMENTVATGSTTVANLRKVLRVSLSFHDMLDIISGTVGFGNHQAKGFAPGILDGSVYHLIATTDDGSIEYFVDLNLEAIKRYIRKDGDGEIIEDVTFRDFRKRYGLYLPTIISINRPVDEETLSLVYDEQTINKLPLDFTFRVPGSARKIIF